MDSLSQALLGAATFAIVKDKYIGKKSLIIGAIAGSLPDLYSAHTGTNRIGTKNGGSGSGLYRSFIKIKTATKKSSIDVTRQKPKFFSKRVTCPFFLATIK